MFLRVSQFFRITSKAFLFDPHGSAGVRRPLSCPNRRLRLTSTLILCLLSATYGSSSEPNVEISPRDRIYADDHLVDIQIQIPPPDWNIIREQTRSLMESLAERESVKSPFDYVSADVTIDGKTIKEVGIRKKGFLGSLDNERPSLKIKFDKYRDQSPYGDLDRLTLNNNKQDPSRLSQYLSYRFFNQSGVFAPRCNFAKVTVNGQYLGIYSNVEAIKPPMLKTGFGDGDGLLFEGTVADLIPGSTDRLEGKTKRSKTEELGPTAAVLAQKTIDIEQLNQHVDLDAFIRFWAVESLIGFWDGYAHNQNNYYLYKNPNDAKFYFLPWGTDSAFSYNVPSVIDKIQHNSVHSNAVLPNRLYRNRSTRQRYYATLQSLLNDSWNEAEFAAEIARVHEAIKDHVLDRASFDKGVKKVSDFVNSRRAVIEKELQDWPLPINSGPRRPGFTKVIGKVTARFKTQWSTPMFFQDGHSGEADIHFTSDGEKIAIREMKATTKFEKAKKNAPGDNRQSPTITLSAVRESDSMPLSFGLTFSPDDFKPAGHPVPINGLYREGSLLTFLAMMSANPGAIKIVEGTAQLEQASTDLDAPISGTADFKIFTFSGGNKPKLEWTE